MSLFPVGGGKHCIRVRKKVRVEANLKEGDRVTVRVRVVDRDADSVIPKDLEIVLCNDHALNDFKAIPPGARNYLLRRIADAVKPETRKKRLVEALEAAYLRREKRKDW